jgi:hypothetical protein
MKRVFVGFIDFFFLKIALSPGNCKNAQKAQNHKAGARFLNVLLKNAFKNTKLAGWLACWLVLVLV